MHISKVCWSVNEEEVSPDERPGVACHVNSQINSSSSPRLQLYPLFFLSFIY